MAITLVGVAKYTPTSSITSRTLAMPAGVQAGDVIFVQVVSASAATANNPTVTGIADLLQIGDQAFGGHDHNLFLKEAAAAADIGATLTIATAAALRVTVTIAVWRGAAVSAVIDKLAGVNGPAGTTTTITSPTLQTTASATVELQFIAGAGGAAALASLTPPAGTVTKIVESYDAKADGAGASHAAVAHSLTQLAAGSAPGGDQWTASSAVLLSAITVALKVAVAATSVRPNNSLTSTGWTPSTGTSISALLADESDTTFAEGPDNPNGTQPYVTAFPEIAAGNLTLRTRGYATAAAPLLQRTVRLEQGATVIASRTVVLSTTPTDFDWTTTATETANITDRTQLRGRVVDVVQ